MIPGHGVGTQAQGRLDKTAGEQLVRVRSAPTKLVRLPQPHDGPCLASLNPQWDHCLFCHLPM